MKKILFVCSGNTCRSPMAEAYFNLLVKQNNLTGKWEAVSAGLHAFEGAPVNERSLLVCSPDNIDLSLHHSQPVRAELIHEAVLVLTMTREQKEETFERFPDCKGKTHTVKEFVNSKGDISDPIGLGEQVYESTYREIKEAVDLLFVKCVGDRSLLQKDGLGPVPNG